VPLLLTDHISIAVKERWKHVYRCSKTYYEKQSGFAEFCFRCSKWISSEIDWEAHCQDHIDNLDVPFRCDPVTFRHAVACAGYCSRCLGGESLPAAVRMKQFQDRTSWQRHISECILDYVKSLDIKDSIRCPHLLCSAVLYSESDLWHHLEDIHSTHKPNTGKKRQSKGKEDEDEQVKVLNATKRKRPRLQGKLEDEDSKVPGGRKSAPKGRSKDLLGHMFVNVSAMDFDPGPAEIVEMAVVSSGSSCRSTPDNSVWDKHDDCYSTDTSLSSLPGDILEAVPQTGEGCHSPWTIPLGGTTVDPFGDAEPWNVDANADAISSPISSQEDRVLSGPDTPPLYLEDVANQALSSDMNEDMANFSRAGSPATVPDLPLDLMPTSQSLITLGSPRISTPNSESHGTISEQSSVQLTGLPGDAGTRDSVSSRKGVPIEAKKPRITFRIGPPKTETKRKIVLRLSRPRLTSEV
jgi:hypothetical protein